ncbi:hypothetical protein BCR44DRAFT_199995 [Catenaria anguillulae PL171]|uniref:Uncharacterized protein n=1 Tax=Catenaria anguillulae PL171 TaxID=765915 RepID=A0A1Y2I7M0_9FUNG|nr:hypothetical protein BCR44DRAFT_199995 [Catenaria anguillulae PL171]
MSSYTWNLLPLLLPTHLIVMGPILWLSCAGDRGLPQIRFHRNFHPHLVFFFFFPCVLQWLLNALR